MSILQWLGVSPMARAFLIIRWQAYDSGYHLYVEKVVRRLGLIGWMRVTRQPMTNYLEMEVEGRQSKLQKLVVELQKGPVNSGAQRAEIQWKTYKGEYETFRSRA